LYIGVQFLCNGIEDDMIMRLKAVNGKAPSRPEALEAASGKLLLVRKLLTKLRSEKRRVLIFSQFKIMLDLLEEMLEEHLQLPYERLDGDTKGAVL
jgi:SNF2 family DNA or RNA helicase